MPEAAKSGVYWNTLEGDKVHCLGINVSAGDDAAGLAVLGLVITVVTMPTCG